MRCGSRKSSPTIVHIIFLSFANIGYLLNNQFFLLVNNQISWIGLDTYSRSSTFNPLVLIFHYPFVCFLPDHVRVTDEARLAKILKCGSGFSFFI